MEAPQLQFIDFVFFLFVVKVIDETVAELVIFGVETETVEVSQLQFIEVVPFQFVDEVVDMPVVHVRFLSC